jgi:hypothetical protein
VIRSFTINRNEDYAPNWNTVGFRDLGVLERILGVELKHYSIRELRVLIRGIWYCVWMGRMDVLVERLTQLVVRINVLWQVLFRASEHSCFGGVLSRFAAKLVIIGSPYKHTDNTPRLSVSVRMESDLTG